jgi:hypothetical protein
MVAVDPRRTLVVSATLQDMADHYNTFMKLGLTTAETRDLIEYLKSL